MKSVLSAVLRMADKSPLNEAAGLGAATGALWGLESGARSRSGCETVPSGC
jgi:hypothetical protein